MLCWSSIIYSFYSCHCSVSTYTYARTHPKTICADRRKAKQGKETRIWQLNVKCICKCSEMKLLVECNQNKNGNNTMQANDVDVRCIDGKMNRLKIYIWMCVFYPATNPVFQSFSEFVYMRTYINSCVISFWNRKSLKFWGWIDGFALVSLLFFRLAHSIAIVSIDAALLDSKSSEKKKIWFYYVAPRWSSI